MHRTFISLVLAGLFAITTFVSAQAPVHAAAYECPSIPGIFGTIVNQVFNDGRVGYVIHHPWGVDAVSASFQGAEYRGVFMFDLQGLSANANFVLSLEDGGLKADGISNHIQLSWFSPVDFSIETTDYGRSATPITILVTSGSHAGEIAPVYTVDVNAIVTGQIKAGKRYIGFRVQPTKSTDWEGFAPTLVASGNCEVEKNLAVTSVEVTDIACSTEGRIYIDVPFDAQYTNPEDEGAALTYNLYLNDILKDTITQQSAPPGYVGDTFNGVDLVGIVTGVDYTSALQPFKVEVEIVPPADFDDSNSLDNIKEIEYTLGELPAGCPCKPEINSVTGPVKTDIAFHYSVDTKLTLPSSCPVPRDLTFSIRETAASEPRSFQRGDKLSAPPALALRLRPGETKTLSFPFRHTWDWTGTGTDGCFADVVLTDLQAVGLDVAFEQTASYIKGATSLLNLLQFYIKLFVDPIIANTYELEVSVSGGTSSPVTGNYPGPTRVEVPLHKQQAWGLYQGSMATASMSTFAGAVALLTGLGVPAAPGLFGVEAVHLVNACLYYDRAVLLDGSSTLSGASTLNYTELAEPQVIDLPALNTIDASPAEELAQATIEAAVLYQVVTVSLQRYQAAMLAEDDEWSARQLAHAQKYNDLYQTELQQMDLLISAYISHIEELGLVFNAENLQQAQAKLRSEGLPQLERDILQQYGFSSAEIDSLGAVTPDLLNLEGQDWQAALQGHMKLMAEDAAMIDDWLEQQSLVQRSPVLYIPMLVRD